MVLTINWESLLFWDLCRGVQVVDRSGKLRTSYDRPSLRILLQFKGFGAVRKPKGAIERR
ncbi:hypothetical protein IQ269_01775 [Tychonema sp. LEGE 07199]|uniref:hypothetical protein n=1 Tax=unclassified Tychonema TaxID=2642144 RepID=UPI00187E94C7|nr:MULTISPECIES: hypothetical protein [unclassified Tychonema]MBE9119562.1 hypothetical protein [Tychonema sp. LEGE 07199]MBE9131766.1 hypothetical protein [Tychonema sp. LEGE 07196]